MEQTTLIMTTEELSQSKYKSEIQSKPGWRLPVLVYERTEGGGLGSEREVPVIVPIPVGADIDSFKQGFDLGLFHYVD